MTILLAGLALADDAEHMGMTMDEMPLVDEADMRNVSGTAWQPSDTPMYGSMGMAGPVMLMGHANVFGLYDLQTSERGDGGLSSVNWAMGRASVGSDTSMAAARAMISLEPLTVGADGYPLLGQSGETYDGEQLHDRQHPHDLFMELALLGRQSLGKDVGVELYVAPAGEPALGPVAFPHRASAMSDPIAPIGHHWEDSTHISFGVVTGGVFTRWGKVEGTWFNGREPDEDRYDLDLAVPDSGSARLTVAPGKHLAAQVSYGYLASPEALHPGVPVQRITASVMVDRDLAGQGNVAATAAWGRNVQEGLPTDGVLVEGDVSIGKHVNAFGRAEYVVKTADDLDVGGPPDRTFGLTSLALGHVYTVEAFSGWDAGLGVRGNVTVVPAALEATYGTRAPVGAVVYLQLRPQEHEHEMRGMARRGAE